MATPTIAQMFDIKCKGIANRIDLAGIPSIETKWHKALEQGRIGESDVADANHWILQKQQDLQQKITTYLHMTYVGTAAELDGIPKVLALVAEIAKITQEVTSILRDIKGLVIALQQNMAFLQQIENSLFSLVQQRLSQLAALMQDICNWRLPNLPSIPVQFEGLLDFPGFNFLGFKPSLPSLQGFSFSQCQLKVPQLNIFSNFSGLTSAGLSYDNSVVLPFGGSTATTTLLSDPTYVAQLQSNTTNPVYLPPDILVSTVDGGTGGGSGTGVTAPTGFNPSNSMLGSLPDPATIVSKYQMPPATYQANVISTIPGLQSIVAAADTSALPSAIAQQINLFNVVASNYDPNLTAAWLIYLNNCRNGRGGNWLSKFQDIFSKFIQPSNNYLNIEPVPWNNVEGGSGVSAGPQALPLVTQLNLLTNVNLNLILWQLSYIEASLLGYTRCTQWDNSADSEYLSTFSGSALDFVPTTIDLASTVTMSVGSSHPVSVTYPAAMQTGVSGALMLATTSIQANPNFSAPSQFQYVFTVYGQPQKADSETQFWNQWSYNLQQLLAQDPYVVSFLVTYQEVLDSAINPLADTTLYNYVRQDALTRNRTWIPGTPLLPLPAVPVTQNIVTQAPDPTSSGWVGDSFHPDIFLQRPDVQCLSIPTQMAMVQINASYAALKNFQQTMGGQIATALASAQGAVTALQITGFQVEVQIPVNVPSGSTPTTVVFDTILMGTDQTIPQDGSYTIAGSLQWGTGLAGVRTLTLYQNSTVLYTVSSEATQTGPYVQSFSYVGNFTTGDTIAVKVVDGLADAQTIEVGSILNVLLNVTSNPTETGGGGGTGAGVSDTQSFVCNGNLAEATAVSIDVAGKVAALDPVGSVQPIFVDGVTLASKVSGALVEVACIFGEIYEIADATFTTGELLYVGLGGVLTQDYATLITEVVWVVSIGKATDATHFIFGPHVPVKIADSNVMVNGV